MKRQQMLKNRSYPALLGALRILFALMIFMVSTGLVFAQKTVTGTVTGTDNTPLPGVSIVVKGTTTGTITDINGKYSLSVPSDAKNLLFTFVGMESKQVTIGTGLVYDVILTEGLVGLEEVVVIGYGKQSRELITTSISKLDNKVLNNIPYSHVGSALQGTVPGVRVQSISGQPGAQPVVIIRGGTSINNSRGYTSMSNANELDYINISNVATPLYVIDGVIRDNMNNINPTDIESIQVLKDAASTAIYGARSSNGVIIIVTKSGEFGKTQVNYKSDLTFSKVGKLYDLLDARDFVYYSRLGIMATAGIDPSFLPLLTGNNYTGGTGNDLTNNTVLSLQYLTPENEYKLKEGWESMPDPLSTYIHFLVSDTVN